MRPPSSPSSAVDADTDVDELRGRHEQGSLASRRGAAQRKQLDLGEAQVVVSPNPKATQMTPKAPTARLRPAPGYPNIGPLRAQFQVGIGPSKSHEPFVNHRRKPRTVCPPPYSLPLILPPARSGST